ncbi:hypothetical protein CEXT_584661 [Caerostris extrusa]|uniref:Uncharacterized protein n=1 Tax=Caerostris extrusa TaxID=172846 RepID=A0AAV4U776_CAEEX|nr:hypothetical protein CEXT_584661 [Caerostris extrusa]
MGNYYPESLQSSLVREKSFLDLRKGTSPCLAGGIEISSCLIIEYIFPWADFQNELQPIIRKGRDITWRTKCDEGRKKKK